MGKREQPHARRGWSFRLSGWVPEVLVALALAVGAVQVEYDVAGRLGLVADPATEPAEVRPPAGVEVPEQGDAVPVAAGAHSAADADAVRRALAGVIPSNNFGKRTVALVTDLEGSELFRAGSGAITPASNTKLLTTMAALSVLGPEATFRTTVSRVGAQDTIYLVGGGDPYLVRTKAEAKKYPPRATLADLAASTAAALKAGGTTRVQLRFDDSLFTGPAVNPHWPSSYIPEMVVPPITALWVNQGDNPRGWGYVADPSASAATQFAEELRQRGIAVTGQVARAQPPQGATWVAQVESAPLSAIVHRIVSASDNNAAEVVLRQLGAATGDASSDAAARVALDTVARLGVDITGAQVHDGSGLSRENRLSADTLADVLRIAASASHPNLRSVITGLSVAGYDGSLGGRFRATDPAARGRVLGKTGTLTGVHGLAGVATDLTGAPMIYVVMTDQVPVPKTMRARLQLERFAAALGGCRCGAAG